MGLTWPESNKWGTLKCIITSEKCRHQSGKWGLKTAGHCFSGIFVYSRKKQWPNLSVALLWGYTIATTPMPQASTCGWVWGPITTDEIQEKITTDEIQERKIIERALRAAKEHVSVHSATRKGLQRAAPQGLQRISASCWNQTCVALLNTTCLIALSSELWQSPEENSI